MSTEPPRFPPAELDRRFYAFAIDRLIAWPLAGLAAFVAYRYLIAEGAVVAGIAVIVASLLLIGFGLSALQGLKGFSPGKALLGLRVVHLGSGTPIGIVAAMIRSLILGLSAVPTFGIGIATLAWTAVMDRERQRRGWHDHMTESIVVDVRPVPEEAVEVDHGPRHVVNLTALRLVPTPQPAPARPSRSSRQAVAPGAHTASAVPVPAGTPGPAGLPPNYAPPNLPPATPPADAAAPAASPALRAPLGPPRTTEPAAPTAPTPTVPPAAAPRSGLTKAAWTTLRDAGSAGLARWRVTFDTGESFVVEGMALVGRRPEPRQGEPVRHLVPLPSPDMSLSKTHAQFQVAPDGALVVMDRGSTNGSVVVRGGASRELPADKPATLLSDDVVRFGDRTMTVSRES